MFSLRKVELPSRLAWVKSHHMNAAEHDSKTPLSLAEKLTLAQEAFRKYQTACFWFMREDIVVGPDDLPIIAKGLRSHGDRQAFIIAGKLCR